MCDETRKQISSSTKEKIVSYFSPMYGIDFEKSVLKWFYNVCKDYN